MNSQVRYVPPPDFIRLPRAGDRCPHTGLSRSSLFELIVPSKRNDFRPPVKSKHVKRPGAMRGVRIIFYPSLMEFLSKEESVP